MEGIEFTIHHNGADRHFIAIPRKYGYTFRIEVKIEDMPVAFEPDEEGQLRAVVEPQDRHIFDNMDTELVRAIAEELQEALK